MNKTNQQVAYKFMEDLFLYCFTCTTVTVTVLTEDFAIIPLVSFRSTYPLAPLANSPVSLDSTLLK